MKSNSIRFKMKCLLKVFSVCFLLGLIILSLSYFSIASEKTSEISDVENTSVIVVLGAGLWGDQVSPQLALRLDTAYHLMEKNEDIIVVVSGGQGTDELTSEADAMKKYLIKLGAESSRIHLEDQSTSTVENLKFSFDKINSLNLPTSNIAIVTTDFHLFRSKLIAKRLGYVVDGEAAPNMKSIILKNNIREIFALIKDFVTCF